jgi:hypothetical protein
MKIHFPGREGLDKLTVWVFPRVVPSSDCGLAELVVPKNELHALMEGLTRPQTNGASLRRLSRKKKPSAVKNG